MGNLIKSEVGGIPYIKHGKDKIFLKAEEINKIGKGYDYNIIGNSVVFKNNKKTKQAIDNDIMIQKDSIIRKIGHKLSIKNALLEMTLDTTTIDTEIQDLKDQYNAL